jgi:cysteine desulfurase
VAKALGCADEEICFTSGGTEANNLAILGGAEALRRRGKTLVAMSYEHASVLEPLRYLEKQGWTLRLADPAPDGTVDAEKLLGLVDDDTVLVSCMLVNSEVGTVAPIQELARDLRRKNKRALLHCDGVQAFGKLPFSASKLGVDLLSVSAHKIHGPKGCGALYVRKGAKLLPRIYGGGQEKAMRPGTENVPAICAFGLASENAAANLAANLAHVQSVYEYFVNSASKTPGVRINSPREATPYLCNISVPGYRSEILLHYLGERGIYVSSGSACSKGAKSHVLAAMGLPANLSDSALRVSFSRYTTTEDIDAFFAGLTSAMENVARVR